jgi:hypothetical protein
MLAHFWQVISSVVQNIMNEKTKKKVTLWESRNAGVKPVLWFWSGAIALIGLICAAKAIGIIQSPAPVDKTLNIILAVFLFILAALGILAIRSMPYFPPKLRRQMKKQNKN